MSDRKDPRELFGLLCQRVQQFSMAPGGIPVFTQDDIAHALGKIQVLVGDGNVIKNNHLQEAIMLARIKYAGETEYCEEFVLALRRKALLRLNVDDWRVPRPNFVLDMCWLALIEVIDPACPACDGIEYRMIDNKPVVCPECNGGGRLRITDKTRANFLLCSPTTWSQHWSKRYESILEIPKGWDEVIGPALRKMTKVNQYEAV